MITLRNPRASKLARCQTAAEYHRLLVVTRVKSAPKPGRQSNRQSGPLRKGVPQP